MEGLYFPFEEYMMVYIENLKELKANKNPPRTNKYVSQSHRIQDQNRKINCISIKNGHQN